MPLADQLSQRNPSSCQTTENNHSLQDIKTSQGSNKDDSNRVSFSKQQVPLETESNLNYEQDHQESPIDCINETAKMKHLNG